MIKLLMLVIFLVINCNKKIEPDIKQFTKQKTKLKSMSDSVMIDLDIEHNNLNQIIIKGKTNLPDNTKAYIVLGRKFKILNTDYGWFYQDIVIFSNKFSVTFDGKRFHVRKNFYKLALGYYRVGFNVRSTRQLDTVSEIIGFNGGYFYGKDVINEDGIKHIKKEIKFQLGTDQEIKTQEQEELKYLQEVWKEMKGIVKEGRAMNNVRARYHRAQKNYPYSLSDEEYKLISRACYDRFEINREKIDIIRKRLENINGTLGQTPGVLLPFIFDWYIASGYMISCINCAECRGALKSCNALDSILNINKPIWKEKWD